MKFALKAGFLSFNSTRVSANDVDYPIDVVYYEKDSFNIIEKRYGREELQQVSKVWQNKLSETVTNLPEDWLDKLFIKENEEGNDSLEEINLNNRL